MPIIVPRKNAAVTQPYQLSPPRSFSTWGRIVVTASDSNATRVTTDTSPILSARRPGSTGARSGALWPSPCSPVVTNTLSTVRLQAPLKSSPAVDTCDVEGLVQLVQFSGAARRGVRLRGRGRRGAHGARPDRDDPR